MRFWWIFKAAIVRGLFAIALSLAFVTASYAQSQIDAVADYNAKEPLKSSVWGVFAVNMNGDTLVNYNGSQRMVPASNVKLITTGVALNTLGADYRFKTGIGYVGEIHGETLVGDLYILGGADPTIGVRENVENLFLKWKGILDNAGIKTISGRLIADSRYLKDGDIEKSWLFEDIESGDALVPRGLNFKKNVKDYDHLFSRDFVAQPSPMDTCANAFRKYLEKNGIHVTGGTSDSSSPEIASRDGIIELGCTYSSPLSEIVKETNYRSDNFFAETMYRLLSDRYLPLPDALTQMGLETRGRVQLLDGCGLSRKDYVSPEFFVSFLTKMYGTKVFESYLKSLPQPGEGTLSRRLYKASDAVKKRVYMKSGSMNGVCCYSGYILPQNGEDPEIIAFSLMTNNVIDPHNKLGGVIDEIIQSLAGLN